KGRPAVPFETIAVAIAFSPRMEAIIGEAWRLAGTFHSKLLLMHIGDRTRAKEAQLDEIFRRLGVDESKVRVIWNEGEPVDTLLELCKLNIVDLLITGAMQKENVLKYYLGSVARQISRKAKCSVLLLVNPVKTGTRFRKIMVNGISSKKTGETIQAAVYFAKHIGAKEMTVAVELDDQGLSMTVSEESTASEAYRFKKDLTADEVGKVHDIVTRLTQDGDLTITEKVLKGKPGFAIRQYAETKKADLLVINSPDGKYGLIDRIFTHDMEYILEDLPCNILIVHSRER
ncbi:MAG TPA: universal stress protein, partial [Bacteroidia bacterium]|nr:universal stress protein [Bacteroidia bacterium]